MVRFSLPCFYCRVDTERSLSAICCCCTLLVHISLQCKQTNSLQNAKKYTSFLLIMIKNFQKLISWGDYWTICINLVCTKVFIVNCTNDRAYGGGAAEGAGVGRRMSATDVVAVCGREEGGEGEVAQCNITVACRC